jgi:hypothetical protein
VTRTYTTNWVPDPHPVRCWYDDERQHEAAGAYPDGRWFAQSLDHSRWGCGICEATAEEDAQTVAMRAAYAWIAEYSSKPDEVQR